MAYCLLFTSYYFLLYNFIETDWRRSMNIPLASGRRETYALNVAGGLSGAESARLAGYCPEHPANARVMSWYLLKRPDVRDRIAWLQAQATDKAILNLTQIKVILSQIGRAVLKDYQREDGSIRPLDKNSPNPSAVAEVIYAYDSVKREPYPVRIRLHDAVGAIVQLCKLDGSYLSKKPVQVQVAPIANVTLESARAKVASVIKSVTIESGDMSRELGDRCEEHVPLLPEHTDTKNSEVQHETRVRRTIPKTQIG